MKQFCLTVILSLGMACASAGLSLKQKAVVSLQASELALEASHDAERLLCSPNADKSLAITHCDGPFGISDAKHHTLAVAFSNAFSDEIKAATVLKTWEPGDTAPSTVAAYVKDADAILKLIGEIIPSTENATLKAREAAAEAAKVAVIVGVK